MLKIKDDIHLKLLKEYGFKIEPEHNFYYKLLDDCELFIWSSKKDKYFKYKHIYLEFKEYTPQIINLDIIYDLIKAGYIEKGEDYDYS